MTDPKLGFQGLIKRIEQLKESDPNVYVLDQFANPANPEAHFTGTGKSSQLAFVLTLIAHHTLSSA